MRVNYDQIFDQAIDRLHEEGRYRVFADLERNRGDFPRATHHRDGERAPVTVWCSNDYLGMGQHPDVLAAMHEALDRFALEDPKKAELVKLRYFVGLTLEDAASALGLPLGTAKRWWTYSRAWLFRELSRE